MWNAQQQVLNLQDISKYRAITGAIPGKRKKQDTTIKGLTPMPKSTRETGREPMSLDERRALGDAQAAARGAKLGNRPSSGASSLADKFANMKLSNTPKQHSPLESPPGTKSTDKNYTPKTPHGLSPYVPRYNPSPPGTKSTDKNYTPKTPHGLSPYVPKPAPLNWKSKLPGGRLRRRTMVPVEQQEPPFAPTPQSQVMGQYMPSPRASEYSASQLSGQYSPQGPPPTPETPRRPPTPETPLPPPPSYPPPTLETPRPPGSLQPFISPPRRYPGVERDSSSGRSSL